MSVFDWNRRWFNEWFSSALAYSVDIYSNEPFPLFNHRVQVDFNVFASIML